METDGDRYLRETSMRAEKVWEAKEKGKLDLGQTWRGEKIVHFHRGRRLFYEGVAEGNWEKFVVGYCLAGRAAMSLTQHPCQHIFSRSQILTLSSYQKMKKDYGEFWKRPGDKFDHSQKETKA
ncbi:hypothetical protein CMI48_03545 [Candidatus Pacearchaeota archaeon]|nr:hypothetical protein [Candidatus Pacearchaeota archaeon]